MPTTCMCGKDWKLTDRKVLSPVLTQCAAAVTKETVNLGKM